MKIHPSPVKPVKIVIHPPVKPIKIVIHPPPVKPVKIVKYPPPVKPVKTQLISQKQNLPIINIKSKMGVVIPTFARDIQNGALDRCLQSIENQTQKPSIVSISASSWPNELKLCNYSFPICIKTTEKTQNAAMNRNIAADMIVNDVDIISFMDSDDEMCSNRVEIINDVFNKTNCDFIVHNHILLKSKTATKSILYKEPLFYENVLCADNSNKPRHGAYVYINSNIKTALTLGHVSIRSDIFRQHRYNETLSGWEDSEYVRRLINLNCKGVYIKTQLSIYHHYRM